MKERAWWRWWAIAAFAHVVATPKTELSAEGVANLIVGWLAIAVIVDPGRRWVRPLLATCIVISFVFETPFVGNHWLLAALVSAASLVVGPWRSGPTGTGVGQDSTHFDRFAATARLLLLAFYGFAAFAKLNSGFVDPVQSCARYFANKTLEFWRLPTIDDGPMATVLIVATIVIELSVPVLLMIPATRRFGVFLAIGFHLALTLDLRQQLQQFTLVLVALFVLFAPAPLLSIVDNSLPRLRLLGGWPWIGLAGLQVMAVQLPLGRAAGLLAQWGAWGTWLVVLACLLHGLVRAWGGVEAGRTAWSLPAMSFTPANVGAVIVIALAALNGLSPYLGLKTATGFNMFANLVAAEGRTNHLVVTRSANLRAAESQPLQVLESDDVWLEFHKDGGYALPAVNLADYLVLAPSASVTVRWPDGTVEQIESRVAPNGPPSPLPGDPSLRTRLQLQSNPWWKERFLALLAVPVSGTAPCESPRLPVR